MSKNKHKIRKNDIVIVLAGKYKNKTGKVLRVIPERDQAVVEQVNLVKKHTRPTQQNQKGGVVENEAPIHISNLKVVMDGEPTRVGIRRDSEGHRIRYSKKSPDTIIPDKL